MTFCLQMVSATVFDIFLLRPQLPPIQQHNLAGIAFEIKRNSAGS
jgi:hypothetical protein